MSDTSGGDAYGSSSDPGGSSPGDPGGPGGDGSSTPEEEAAAKAQRQKWWLGGALGLLAVAVLVLIVVLVVRGGGDDDADSTTTTSTTTTTEATTTEPTTTSTETTTTTTEATTSTTESTPPVTADPAQCRDAGSNPNNPDPAAQAVFVAWTRGDRACAAELMTAPALLSLFERDGSDASDVFQGCTEVDAPDPHTDCAFTYPGGATHYRMNFSPTDGWTVFEVFQNAD